MSNQFPTDTALAKPGAALKALRLKHGWTLAEVSRRTGLTTSTLSKIENDKMSLSFDKLDVEKGMEARGPNGEMRWLKHPWSVLAFQIAGNDGLRALHAEIVADVVGGIEQGFRGDAAAIETNSAKAFVAFDEDDLFAEVGRIEGRGIATWAATENENFGIDWFHKQKGRGGYDSSA